MRKKGDRVMGVQPISESQRYSQYLIPLLHSFCKKKKKFSKQELVI
jgi:hypothetical protein